MKNIFIILGLLVVGVVFIGCPNPNVGGDDYIIENGENNGSENGNSGENNGGNENGNSESNIYQLGTLTFDDLIFVIEYNNQSLTANKSVNGNNYSVTAYGFTAPNGYTRNCTFGIKITNNVLEIISFNYSTNHSYEVSRNGNTFTFTIN